MKNFLLGLLLAFGVYSVSAGVPTSNTAITVPNLTTLTALPIAAADSGAILRLTDGVAGAPAMTFIPESGTCSANSRVNDGASCVNSSSDSNSWVGQFLPAGADVRQWGADPTGGTDATTAIQAAATFTATTGIPLWFPQGLFKMSSKITATLGNSALGYMVRGAGPGSTTLEWTATSGGMEILAANGNQSITVEDLDLTTNQLGGGTALQFAENTSSGTFATALVRNVKIHGADGLNLPTDYWNTHLLIGVSNVNVYGVNMYGDAGFHSTGIDFTQNLDSISNYILNITNSNIYNMNKAVIPETNTQGVTLTQTNIVSGNYGVYVPAGGTNQDQLTIIGGSINTCVIGVDDLGPYTATFIQGVTFIPGSGGNSPCLGGAIGVNIASNVINNVQNNNFQAGDSLATGIQISNGLGRYEGNTMEQLLYGIVNTAGSQFFTILKNNSFAANVGTAYVNSHGDEIDGWRSFPLTLTGDASAGTPTISVNSGVYSRIGKRMNYWAEVNITAWSPLPTGNLEFTGLPFASSASEQTGCTVTNLAGVTLSSGYTSVVGRVEANTQIIQLWQADPNLGAQTRLTASQISSPVTNFQIGIMCFVDLMNAPYGGN